MVQSIARQKPLEMAGWSSPTELPLTHIFEAAGASEGSTSEGTEL